jgi:hypothetical protein
MAYTTYKNKNGDLENSLFIIVLPTLFWSVWKQNTIQDTPKPCIMRFSMPLVCIPYAPLSDTQRFLLCVPHVS